MTKPSCGGIPSNRYHVAFAFKQEHISEVAVFDPNEGPVKFLTEAK